MPNRYQKDDERPKPKRMAKRPKRRTRGHEWYRAVEPDELADADGPLDDGHVSGRPRRGPERNLD